MAFSNVAKIAVLQAHNNSWWNTLQIFRLTIYTVECVSNYTYIGIKWIFGWMNCETKQNSSKYNLQQSYSYNYNETKCKIENKINIEMF